MARRWRRKRHGSRKMTLPIGPIAGIAGALMPAINAGMAGRLTGPDSALSWATALMTGYDDQTRQFNWQLLARGWTPIIAGFAAHKLAGMLGVNRALGSAHVPLIRV